MIDRLKICKSLSGACVQRTGYVERVLIDWSIENKDSSYTFQLDEFLSENYKLADEITLVLKQFNILKEPFLYDLMIFKLATDLVPTEGLKRSDEFSLKMYQEAKQLLKIVDEGLPILLKIDGATNEVSHPANTSFLIDAIRKRWDTSSQRKAIEYWDNVKLMKTEQIHLPWAYDLKEYSKKHLQGSIKDHHQFVFDFFKEVLSIDFYTVRAMKDKFKPSKQPR